MAERYNLVEALAYWKQGKMMYDETGRAYREVGSKLCVMVEGAGWLPYDASAQDLYTSTWTAEPPRLELNGDVGRFIYEVVKEHHTGGDGCVAREIAISVMRVLGQIARGTVASPGTKEG